MELECARSAAEVIRLPTNIFCYRRSPWNKHSANGILHHVILTRRKTIRLTPPLEVSQGASQKEIQHHK